MADLLDAAEPARSAMSRLRDELPAIFGDDVLAIWLYGGQLHAQGSPGDVDGHVVLAQEPSSDQLARARALHAGIRSDFGIQELDVWYVLRSEAAATAPPRDVNWHEEARDENWALKRAHWYAGAYALIFGLPPTDVVPPPTWSEVEAELFAQLDRARDEIEGSAWLAALSLRLCRVVRTLATRDVVQTKLEAAEALLPALSAASQRHVMAAHRAYRGVSEPEDDALMRFSAAGFYADIRALADAGARDRRTDGSVEVVAYDPAWPSMFQAERELLLRAIPRSLTVEHIGSTSVPGLASKPTIDILVVVPAIRDVVPSCVDALDSIGYDYRGPFGGEEEDHVFFRKVRAGKRTHHLHILAEASPEPGRYRLFREFLIASPSAAARYEAYKWDLVRRYGTDRLEYISAKERFVDELMLEAAAWRTSRGWASPERGADGSASGGRG